MIQLKQLTGIGEVEFMGAKRLILTDEFAGLSLIYRTVHGEEDKKHMPNPQKEEQFLVDFDNLYN
jgi:hypothetical protein